MKRRPAGRPSSSEQTIRNIKRKTRKQYGAEEKIRIVLDGLRGEDSIADAVPPRRHCSKSLLQVVQGLHGGRQEALGPRLNCDDTWTPLLKLTSSRFRTR